MIETLVTVWCDGDDCEASVEATSRTIALADAADSGWLLSGGRHLCPACRPAPSLADALTKKELPR